jgi:hypothetical protein
MPPLLAPSLPKATAAGFLAGCGWPVVCATIRAASEFVSSISSKTVRLLARLGMAEICTMPDEIARGKYDLEFQNDTIPEKGVVGQFESNIISLPSQSVLNAWYDSVETATNENSKTPKSAQMLPT